MISYTYNAFISLRTFANALAHTHTHHFTAVYNISLHMPELSDFQRLADPISTSDNGYSIHGHYQDYITKEL